jgi:hypothetical protein
MKVAEIRRVGSILGRADLAERALEIANEMSTGSYKRAMEGCGQLKVLAIAAGFDEYWNEQTLRGEYNEVFRMENTIDKFDSKDTSK